jgi:CBS domain-containing protein
MVYSGKDLLLDSVEVRAVDEANKTITLVVESTQIQRCIGKDAAHIIALPETHKKLMVKDIMARNVRALGPLASVADAISLMTRYRIGSIVVVEGDKAILTDGDILHRLAHRQSDIKATPIRDWMSQPIVDVSSDVSVNEALAIMRNRNVKKLPVTSEGKLVGMVTSNDIFRASSSMS